MRKGLFLILVLLAWSCGGGGGGGSSLSLEPEPSGENQMREVRLGIVPDEWEGSVDSVEAWTRRYGGRVLVLERQENKRIFVEVRIPTSQVDSFLTKVKGLGQVFAEEIRRALLSQSVSAIDSQIRLKEETLERYRALLQKARTPSEILEIEQAMSTTLAERESLLERQQSLRMLSSTVAISIQLVHERYAEIGSGGSFWGQLKRAFVEGWDLFKYFLIGMAYLWWLWLGIALLVWILIRYTRRSNAKQKPPSPPPPNPST